MKKIFKTLPLIALLIVGTSCSSVRVSTDYDKKADFSNFKTFAFFKTGIDKAEINDIDKRRILRAIQDELMAKGFTKSDDPDLLISIFTKSNQRVDVYNNAWGAGAWGWGGWGPWGWGGWGWGPGWGWGWNQPAVSTRTEGVLFVDLINAKKKELIWQGMGKGFLASKPEKKEERIKEFVAKIMEEYPPGTEK
ncbi:DUF4136 domain-containing protein [Hyunsoonleella sp. SJ7]|uniref:DUF4136 domain-containing protein n=1 Tax=Hyunsoonleella aquatilis TaxID=2762758 RepID=A0A923H806_9FLAO|nr:DUF4136 domain-containing protein [Hyunsoonleella aquatilis]MBC3757885.1 DUF4136 domain-containing protein [Hyunsoonleella aquatilis]